MHRSHATLAVLALALAPLACDAGGDAAALEHRAVDRAELSLDDGTELLFLAEDDGEVSILEVSPSPGRPSLMAALEDGETPAELWVAVAEGEAVPEFLVEHHEATVDRALELDPPRVTTRGWSKSDPAWGGSDGYCRDVFPSDFEAYNPVTTSVSVAGFTGAPNADAIYGYSNVYVKHAWVAVCNDTPLSASGTQSEVGISRWNAATSQWNPILCGDEPWCLTIFKQQAKAFHYWTTALAGQKLRFEGRWGAGETHLSKLRAGYSTQSVGF
ncbi:MAG: hypothetical protein R3B09_17430 [Nannocystaceae bacterium]